MPKHYLLLNFEVSPIQGYLMLMLMNWHFEERAENMPLTKRKTFC